MWVGDASNTLSFFLSFFDAQNFNGLERMGVLTDVLDSVRPMHVAIGVVCESFATVSSHTSKLLTT